MPRLLFDGWSYQDYMTVLGSEDEIEELGSELIDVAKVIKRCVFLQLPCSGGVFVLRVCLIKLWLCRLKDLMASPSSCGASWEETNGSE